MGLFNKKELKRIEELEKENAEYLAKIEKLGAKELFDIQKEIKELQQTKLDVEKNIQEKNEELLDVKRNINSAVFELKAKEEEIKRLDLDLDVMDFGIYTPKYNCMNSEEYATKIKENRNKQKEMIKNKTALNYFDSWTLDGSLAKGRAMNNDNMKMYLRAFNNECDSLISKVKFNNFDRIEERIKKCAKALDKLNQRTKISVSYKYLKLKIDELHLVHEYNCKKQEEKEAMRAAREEEREQAKLQKEIEEVVKANHEKLIEFNEVPDAEQYRETCKIKESLSKKC